MIDLQFSCYIAHQLLYTLSCVINNTTIYQAAICLLLLHQLLCLPSPPPQIGHILQ